MIRCLAVATLLVFAIGCQGMRAMKSMDLIEPFANTASPSGSKRVTPDSERDLCIQTAQTVATRGHFTEAISLYEQAEKLDPKRPQLDRELAPLYALAGKIEKAVERYERAIEKSPNDPELQNNLAWTLMEFNRSAEAIEVIEKALQQFPDHRRLQSSLAIATYRTGDRQSAIQQFTSLYGRSVAYHNVALLDVESGNQENARSAIQLALSDKPASQTIRLASAIETAPANR